VVVVCVWMLFVLFFKGRTAYEVLRSLVGSEMGIRDRSVAAVERCRHVGDAL